MAMEWILPGWAELGAYAPNDPAGSWLIDDPEDGSADSYVLTITHDGDEGVAIFATDPADLVRLAEKLLKAAKALARRARA